jgi:hypothetical protein
VCRSVNAYLLVLEGWADGLRFGVERWMCIYSSSEGFHLSTTTQIAKFLITTTAAIMYFSTLALSTLVTTALASPLFTPRQCTGPSVNSATVSLIKEFEGFVASPAPDPIGLPTVGYGHLCQTSGCSEVPYSFPLSQSTASQLLSSDLRVRINQQDLVV